MKITKSDLRSLIIEELQTAEMLDEGQNMQPAAAKDMKTYVTDSLRIVRAFQKGRKTTYKGMGIRLESKLTAIKRALEDMEEILS